MPTLCIPLCKNRLANPNIFKWALFRIISIGPAVGGLSCHGNNASVELEGEECLCKVRAL